MPSGHSAIAFSIATTIALITGQLTVVILSYVLAFIVAQSRVDSEIHSILEVICRRYIWNFNYSTIIQNIWVK